MSSGINMRTIIADIGKVLTEYRRSQWRCSRKKDALKNVANFTRKHLRQILLLIQFIKKRLQHKCFSVKPAKVFRRPILQNICERLLLRIFQEELLNSTSSRLQQFNECLLTFQVFFSRQYIPVGTLQQNTNNASSLYMTQLAGKELDFQQLSKLIELHYSYKQSDPPTDNCMPKVISHHLKTLKFT